MKPLPKTRKEAMKKGEPFFFTGKPCKRGHVCPRRTKNGDCLLCHRAWRPILKGFAIFGGAFLAQLTFSFLTSNKNESWD